MVCIGIPFGVNARADVGCAIGFGFDARGVRENGYRFLMFFERGLFLGGVIFMPISLNFFVKYSSSGSVCFFMFFVPCFL